MVVCCRRSCLGLAVTRANGFKMDSLSPCFRSMGLSEDREREEEEEEKNQFFTLIIWLTVVIHLPWPSSLSKSVAFSWLTGRSEIACSERSLMLFEGEKGLPENDCWDRGCPDAPNHALHTRTHTHWLCAHVKREGWEIQTERTAWEGPEKQPQQQDHWDELLCLDECSFVH